MMELALKTSLIHSGHFCSKISNSLKISGHSNFELFLLSTILERLRYAERTHYVDLCVNLSIMYITILYFQLPLANVYANNGLCV